MSETASIQNSSSNIDFVEIDSESKVIFDHGGGDRVVKNLIKVRDKLFKLGITERNLDKLPNDRDRYLSILSKYFNSLETDELRLHCDKILDAASDESAEQSKPLYPLWNDRPVRRGTNPAHWILEYHSDLIGTKGARAAIGERDPELIRHYSTWISPGRHPEDDLGLDVPPRANLSGLSASEILDRRRRQVRAAKQRSTAQRPATSM